MKNTEVAMQENDELTKTIKLNFVHACDLAFFSEDKKLNIVGDFKEIRVKQLPAAHPQMYVVTNVTITEPAKYEQEIKFVRGRDNVDVIEPIKFTLTPTNSEEKIEGKAMEFGVIAQLVNLKIEEEGLYKVLICFNNKLFKDIPIRISLIK